MTGPDWPTIGRRLAERSRAEQGLPATVEDVAVLTILAALLLGGGHGP